MYTNKEHDLWEAFAKACCCNAAILACKFSQFLVGVLNESLAAMCHLAQLASSKLSFIHFLLELQKRFPELLLL